MKRLRWIALTLTSALACAQDVTPWRGPSKHSVQFVTVEDGVRLEVLDWGGTGRPVVLLAGISRRTPTMTSRQSWPKAVTCMASRDGDLGRPAGLSRVTRRSARRTMCWPCLIRFI